MFEHKEMIKVYYGYANYPDLYIICIETSLGTPWDMYNYYLPI